MGTLREHLSDPTRRKQLVEDAVRRMSGAVPSRDTSGMLCLQGNQWLQQNRGGRTGVVVKGGQHMRPGQIMRNPSHPYVRELIESVPSLHS